MKINASCWQHILKITGRNSVAYLCEPNKNYRTFFAHIKNKAILLDTYIRTYSTGCELAKINRHTDPLFSAHSFKIIPFSASILKTNALCWERIIYYCVNDKRILLRALHNIRCFTHRLFKIIATC
jgi:hypothetical protein